MLILAGALRRLGPVVSLRCVGIVRAGGSMASEGGGEFCGQHEGCCGSVR